MPATKNPASAALEVLSALKEGASQGPGAMDGLRLVGADLRGLDLSGASLRGVDLSQANLAGTRLFGADLTGAILFSVDARGADFTTADLTGATLTEGNFSRAGFGAATLKGASGARADFTEASFLEVDAESIELVAADLSQTRWTDAELGNADLRRSKLAGADLTGVNLFGARLDDAHIDGARLSRVKGFRNASWLGIDAGSFDRRGARFVHDFIEDQNFLVEYRAQGRAFEWTYRVWWLTSDCGRSAVRWALCSGLIAILFGGIYSAVSIDYGAHETPLSPLYFSVVTLTTLGYGDVLPRTMAAQAAVIVEVILGYVMLGGLLSLISNKLSRRGG